MSTANEEEKIRKPANYLEKINREVDEFLEEEEIGREQMVNVQ